MQLQVLDPSETNCNGSADEAAVAPVWAICVLHSIAEDRVEQVIDEDCIRLGEMIVVHVNK